MKQPFTFLNHLIVNRLLLIVGDRALLAINHYNRDRIVGTNCTCSNGKTQPLQILDRQGVSNFLYRERQASDRDLSETK